jgi:L-alanine-DL-glutamate epimerase-like enolase superfamily enzyme
VKITRIRAYRVVLHTSEGRYAWGKGRFTDELDSTIVRIDTDEGISGYGEVCCPIAPGYTPYFAAGVRAGMSEVAPALMGEDPRDVKCINDIMDRTLTGHDYAKSGIDMACWDILGKAAGLPICTLLGGRFGPDFPLYRPIGQDTPDKMAAKIVEYRAQGYRAFQLKVGADFRTDIERIRKAADTLQSDETLIADANRGWLLHEAMQVVDAVAALPVYIEQPCSTYEECLIVRGKCRNPFVLDESIQSVPDIVRAFADGAADVINLKISKLGGITKMLEARNLCVSLGLPVYIDNAKGGDFVTAAMMHLAHSTPPQFLFATTDFASYIKETLADGTPEKVAGRLAAPTAPGLGITPREAMFGDPLLDVAR